MLPILGVYVSILLSVDFHPHKVKCCQYGGYVSILLNVEFVNPGVPMLGFKYNFPILKMDSMVIVSHYAPFVVKPLSIVLYSLQFFSVNIMISPESYMINLLLMNY